jgi:diaminopimelate epimerase
MQTKFYKYQGTGNDFILFDNRSLTFNKDNTKRIQELCDRKLGIGSDGLMLLESHNDMDFNLVFYNPDASQSFCGNGTRCAVTLASRLGMIGSKGTIEATDGIHDVTIDDNGVGVHMRDVSEIRTYGNDLWLNTGSPHYIVFVEDINKIDVVEEGRKIRYSEPWSQAGTNVNFVEVGNGILKIRTYERGVENETLSCGTGVTAAAIATHYTGKISTDNVKITTLGGDLKVDLKKEENGYVNIWLIGPAIQVFEGLVNL